MDKGAGNVLLFRSGDRNLVEIPDQNALDLTTAFTKEAWIYRKDKAYGRVSSPKVNL